MACGFRTCVYCIFTHQDIHLKLLLAVNQNGDTCKTVTAVTEAIVNYKTMALTIPLLIQQKRDIPATIIFARALSNFVPISKIFRSISCYLPAICLQYWQIRIIRPQLQESDFDCPPLVKVIQSKGVMSLLAQRHSHRGMLKYQSLALLSANLGKIFEVKFNNRLEIRVLILRLGQCQIKDTGKDWLG